MPKILLIDNNESILEFYSGVLTKMSYVTVKSTDATDGVLKLSKERFDLIITDLNLPKIRSNKIIEYILEDQLNTLTPIVISSDHTESNLLEQLSTQKRIHFLPKPVLPQALTDVVSSLLSKGTKKPMFDVRYINPILQGTIQTISEKNITVSKTGAPYVKKPQESSGDLSVLVGVVSAGFKGSISLSFFEPAYLKFLSLVYKIEATKINKDNCDAIADFLKMICDRAKVIFVQQQMSIQLAEPSILNSKNHQISHSSDLPTIVLVFDCQEFGSFRVEICARG